MAEIKVPIQINLPDDWVEQIIERLRNDPEAEWVEIVRCKNCKNIWYSGTATIKGVSTKIYKCNWWDNRVVSEKGFCYMAERKTDA